jgi:PAS domain S-box-containing protein
MEEGARIDPASAFQASLQMLPDGFMLFESVRDSTGRIADFRWIHANPAAAALVGRDAAELEGRLLLEEMPGNRADGLFDAYVAVVETGTRWHREFHYAHEGVDRWFRTTAIRVEDGFAVTFADVTARVDAESELRRQVELTRLITENAETALFMMDTRGHCTFMNPAAERLTGFTLDEIRDMPLHDAIHHTRPDGSPYPISECPIDRALPEDSSVRAHADRFIHKDGTFFDVLCAASPIVRDGVSVGTVVEVRDVTERRRIEAEREKLIAEVSAERARLEEAFRRAPTFLAVLHGEDQVFTLANEAYHQLVARTDIIGKPLLEALPELRGQGFDALLDRVLRTGQPYVGREVLARLAPNPGAPLEDRYVDFTYMPYLDADGVPTGVIAHGADVTETVLRRREAEQHAEELAFAADASRELSGSLELRSTLDALGRVVVPTLGDVCVVDMVDDAGTLVRRAGSHAVPDQADRFADLLRSAPASPSGIPARAAASGRTVRYEVGSDVDGAAAGCLAPFAELAGIREWAAVPIISRDRVLGVITFGSSGEDGDIADRHLRMAEEVARRAAVVLENVRLHREAVDAREEAQEKAVELELQAEELQMQAEELEHAQLEQEMANDELQRVNALLSLQRAEADIARAAADQANEAKSAFLATMSHELRTPINAVIGYAELLDTGIGGEPTQAQRGFIDRIKASSAHLLTLVNEVLDLAQIESGRTRVRRELAGLAAPLRDAIALVQPLADTKGVELLSEGGEPGSLQFLGDEDRVRQILVNLLSNAVKFTSEGGEISIRPVSGESPPATAEVGRATEWIGVAVEDDGIGIPPDRLDAVFEPFVQGEEGLTRSAGGTGLGLTISRHLARLMGGDVTVRSEVGAGSTFTLWLPVGEPEADGLETWGIDPEAVASVRAAGRALMDSAQSVSDRICARLRVDDATTLARSIEPAPLEDHIPTFLTDLGKALIGTDDRGLPMPLVRDSSEIQRLISELHGVQRSQLGWSREALVREFEILREEVAAVASGAVADESARTATIRLIQHHADEAERASLAGWERANARDG